MKKLGFIKKSGFIIGIIVLLMAVMPMSGGLPAQAQGPGWYWKAENLTDYAPSGMPDFDQKQDGWQNPWGTWTYCGPTAVANSMWWFDSANDNTTPGPPALKDNYPLVTNYSAPWDDHAPQNVIPLVNDLAWLMNTDGQNWGPPHNGTDVFDMQKGIDQFLVNAGLYGYYYERTVKSPDFYWIEEEVERCEDVILLLGFWQVEEYEPGVFYWWRIGGHYVTCAGVNSNTSQLAICDPFYDSAEAGFPGRVPVAHNHTANGTGTHNDTQYVSHDIYDVTWDPCPGGNWSLMNYTSLTGPPIPFLGQNGIITGSYIPDPINFPVHTQIDYAVAVSPKPDLNKDIESTYGWAEKEGNVSVTVHVMNETWNETHEIWDMEIYFWDEELGTQSWVWKNFTAPFPLQYCKTYTFNVTWPYTFLPEIVVIHFSNWDEENIGFIFSYEAEEPGWYWKPGNWTDYAPSGMPDFDQRQDAWVSPVPPPRWTYCGPVAVANSLWYFDSREEPFPQPPYNISDNYGLVTSYNPGGWDDHAPQNVIPLVNDLAWLMDTDGWNSGIPHNGTDVHDMEWGIDQYLNNTGYDDDYYEVTVKSPDFWWIEEEVERCEDVILLLGFWQWTGYEWLRLGGHYVTCAGVNSYTWQLGISDPDCDNAEAGGPGIVPVPHPYPHNASVHNDTQYVSHDIYDVIWDPCPGGNWSLANYSVGKDINNFVGQNWAPELLFYSWDYYDPVYPVHTQIDYAVAVSPIVVNATLQGHVDLQARPSPPHPQWAINLSVRFFQGGNETAWSPVNVTTDNNGNFTVSGIASGTYDVGVKSPLTASRLNSSVVLAGNTTVDFGTLLSGDVNDGVGEDPDYISLGDYTKTVTAYDSVPASGNWNAACDFNCDSYVGLDDYTLSVSNYDTVGEMYGM
jgi:hypothetical protein